MKLKLPRTLKAMVWTMRIATSTLRRWHKSKPCRGRLILKSTPQISDSELISSYRMSKKAVSFAHFWICVFIFAARICAYLLVQGTGHFLLITPDICASFTCASDRCNISVIQQACAIKYQVSFCGSSCCVLAGFFFAPSCASWRPVIRCAYHHTVFGERCRVELNAYCCCTWVPGHT